MKYFVEYKKSLILIVFILFLLGGITATSYAWLLFSNEAAPEATAIGTAGLNVNVTKVSPTSNTKVLIPQSEDTLATAVSTNYNCVDDNDNVICHIYKVDVQNTGTATVKVKGYITFTNPSMPNLKYRLMDSATTLNTKTGMYAYEDMNRPLVNDISITTNETKTFYVVMWVNLNDSSIDKSQPDNGTYRATFHFEASELEGATSTFVNYLVGFKYDFETTYFKNATYKEMIKNIAFVDYIDTSNAVETWDMGSLQDGTIIAWVDTNSTDSTYYDLYIGSNDIIYGKDMSYFFDGMTYVDSISFDNLDTSMVTSVKCLFKNLGYNSEVFILDLGDNFDMSSVTNMSHMFDSTGYNSQFFTLNLGNNFDTSSVTDMSNMFYKVGCNSSNFKLDLGSNFDTSNVTNLSNMFAYMATNSTVFTLDLGDKFDTSNVTNMYAMFDNVSKSNVNFMINLGDKFDTSNVTNMMWMFSQLGNSNPNFELDLGDKFYTLNVTNMYGIFSLVGNNNPNFELDLSTLNFDNVTSYTYMFNGFKTTQKIYVKSEKEQTWILDKGFGGLSTNNVIVRS